MLKSILEDIGYKLNNKINGLNEMSPMYVPGDYVPSNFKNKHKSLKDLKWITKKNLDKNNWEMKKIINDVYIFKKFESFKIMIKIDTEIETFAEIGMIELLRVKRIETLKIDYKPLYQVSKIFISELYRGGIGKLLYLYLLEDEKINIMSDGVQFDSPTFIYSKLYKFKDIHCDIVDVSEMKIIEEDYEIYRNENEFWDFDINVWRYDTTKINTRIILYTK